MLHKEKKQNVPKVIARISIQRVKKPRHQSAPPIPNPSKEEIKEEPKKEIKPKEEKTKDSIKEIPKKVEPIKAEKPKQEIKPKPEPQLSQVSKKPETKEVEPKEEDIVPVTEATHFGLNNLPPKYPMISFQLGESGDVQIAYIIDENGKVLEARITESSGFERIDRVALIEFKKWKFKPSYSLTGRAVRSKEQTITFSFNIQTQSIIAK